MLVINVSNQIIANSFEALSWSSPVARWVTANRNVDREHRNEKMYELGPIYLVPKNVLRNTIGSFEFH